MCILDTQTIVVKSFFESQVLLECHLPVGGPLDFGTWLAERRRDADLTLRELAKRTRLSLPYVAALERGTSEPPPLRTCKALARGLGIGWEDVWERSFAARLKRWLKREGCTNISDDEIFDIARKIGPASR